MNKKKLKQIMKKRIREEVILDFIIKKHLFAQLLVYWNNLMLLFVSQSTIMSMLINKDLSQLLTVKKWMLNSFLKQIK